MLSLYFISFSLALFILSWSTFSFSTLSIQSFKFFSLN